MASVQTLRPFFFLVTVLLLIDSFRRRGFTRRNFGRALFSAAILAMPTVLVWSKGSPAAVVKRDGGMGEGMSDAVPLHGSCH